MSFDEIAEESLGGFSSAGHMDLEELRLLYYGRRGIYLSFTDDEKYELEPDNTDIDRPTGILCYKINDVVGRKAKTSKFYAYVFRMGSGNVLTDIRRYDKEDFNKDVEKLRSAKVIDPELFDRLEDMARMDVTFRYEFHRLWELTKDLSYAMRGDHNAMWRKIFLELGYDAIEDPKGSGLFDKKGTPVSLYLDFGKRYDFDILDIQKYRTDPRKHVRERIDKRIRRMGVRRERIAKRRTNKGSYF